MNRRAPLLLALLCMSLPASVPSALANEAQARAMQAQEARIARLEAQLQNQGLLNLLNQLETLKDDVARLRGAQEEQAHRLDGADQRAKEIFVDLDTRISELANRPSVAAPPAQTDAIRLQPAQSLLMPPGPAPLVDVEAERRAYNTALNLVRSGRYSEGLGALQIFLRQYPTGTLAANAMYWMAFSHVGLSDFQGAVQGYQRMLAAFPNSGKAPDGMLSLARAQVQLRDSQAARATLENLLTRHPRSEAAEGGRKLLETLR